MKTGGYKVSFGDFWRVLAAGAMLASGVLRLVAFWMQRDAGLHLFRHVLLQGVLPVAACLWFAVAMAIPGVRGMRMTLMPVIMGCTFFMVKALEFEAQWHTILCHMLYTAVGLLFIFTVFEEFNTPVFALAATGMPLLAHIGMDAWEAFSGSGGSLADWLLELSVLLIIAGMFFASVSIARGMRHGGREKEAAVE